MSESHDAFIRKTLLQHPDILIESTCERCNLSIIANSPASLEQQELAHRENCPVRADTKLGR